MGVVALVFKLAFVTVGLVAVLLGWTIHQGQQPVTPAAYPQLLIDHVQEGIFVSTSYGKVFVRTEGPRHGETVVLVHGVPDSSFLYREMLKLLGELGLNAIAFDFPGMGMSEAAAGASFDWHYLADSMEEITNALNIDKMHLVIHDIGGPIATEFAIHHPDKVQSITILNTLLDLEGFQKPAPMAPFESEHGDLYLSLVASPVFAPLAHRLLQAEGAATLSLEAVQSYSVLLRQRRDSFLRVMRGWDLGPAHAAFLKQGLARLSATTKFQILWGEQDLDLYPQLAKIQALISPEQVRTFPVKHFLQEDIPRELSEAIASFIEGLPKEFKQNREYVPGSFHAETSGAYGMGGHSHGHGGHDHGHVENPHAGHDHNHAGHDHHH